MLLKIKSKETRFSKGERVCASVLAVLMLISMLMVGSAVSLKVDADTINDSSNAHLIYPGKELFIDVSEVAGSWFNEGCQLVLRYWFGVGENAKEFVLAENAADTKYKVTDGIYYFIAQENFNATAFLVYAKKDTAYVHQTPDIYDQSLDTNCFRVKSTTREYDGKQECDWYYYDDSGYTRNGTGEFLTAEQGFGEEVEGVKLFPVDAQFYDYYTDYEIEYGWRSQKNENAQRAVSRTWMNSYPFNNLNKYISNKAENASGWQYPLYFGNFFTYTGYYYRTEAQAPKFDNGNPERDGGMVNRFNQSSPLVKFSSQANNSMFLTNETNNDGTREKYDNGVKYSFPGLVNSTLKNDNITMGTGQVDVPYFSDSLVTDGYATKVTTKFPMRVTNKTTDDGKRYKTYSFNSANGEDNVYFSDYDSSSNFKLNYSTRKKTQDALSGFDKSSNGKGFFPFDNENGESDTLAYDFGFGVRWDIPFNLTWNGRIAGSNQPIEFNFSGDDDVWVFVDGQLALDLGGDHKWATGKIDFADKKSYIKTGVYTPDGTYDNPSSYFANSTHNLTYSNGNSSGYAMSRGDGTYTASLDTGVFAENNFYSKMHTLTVFYMERGMSESNLWMEFSMSPCSNKLTVDNKIDYSDVTSDYGIKDRVASYIENTSQAPGEKFDFDVKYYNESTTSYEEISYYGEKTYDKKYYNSSMEENISYTDGGPEVDHKEMVTFTDQIDDGWNLKIAEDIDNNNNYTYDTYYTVDDNCTGTYAKNDAGADIKEYYPNHDPNDGGNVDFKFQTTNTDPNAYNDFSVHAVNKIKTGGFKITKQVQDASGTQITDDNTSFTFDVDISLPHEKTKDETTGVYTNDYTPLKDDGSGISIKQGEAKAFSLDGLPVGSKVKIKERDTSGYQLDKDNTSPKPADDGTIVIDITENSSENVAVAFVNKKAADPTAVKLSLEGTKNLDGSPSSEQFYFTLHSSYPCTTDNQIGDSVKNGTDGKITFTDFATINKDKYDAITTDPKTVVYYVKEAALDSSSNYTGDSRVYKVTYTITLDTANNKYVASAPAFEVTTNGTDWTTETGVVFNNTTKPGQVEVTKKGSDNKLLSDVTIALVAAEKVGGKWQPKSGAAETTQVTGTNGIALFENVPVGDYVVYEVKATADYELFGEYIHVNVTANNKAEVAMTDPKTTQLPKTGGIGTVLFITIGIILIAGAVYLLKPSKKDIQKAKEKDV